MERFMRGNGKMDRKMEMESKNIRTEKGIKDNGYEIKDKAQEDCFIITRSSQKVLGVMINSSKESLKLNTIKDNGKTITSMEQVAIHSKMVASMMASGSMDKSTAKDYMLIRMAIHMKANFPEV
jgi:hypothetical protein